VLAAPSLQYYPLCGNQSEDWSQDSSLSDLITRYAASSSLWHPMLNKGEKHLPNSTDQFRATLRGRYLCLRFDSPHTFKISAMAVEGDIDEVVVKELVVGLSKNEDGKVNPFNIFGITPSGAIVQFQKYSGTMMATKLSPILTEKLRLKP
jgi:hypothetical protein